MKRNILKVALVAAFALIAGFNVYNSQKEELALSDLMLDGIEALASAEGCTTIPGSNNGKCTRQSTEANWKCTDSSWWQSNDCIK